VRVSGFVAAIALSVTCVPGAFAQTAVPVTPADYNFIMQAASSGWGEVAAAQLAPQRTTNPGTLQTAAMMVRDHTQANQELAGLATARGVTPPTMPDPGRQGVVTMLGELTGPSFDLAYVQEQIPDHQVGIALYQAEAQSSPDPQLRGFAQKYLPVLQQHLQTLVSLNNMAAAR
jgi:putative membrane protein